MLCWMLSNFLMIMLCGMTNTVLVMVFLWHKVEPNQEFQGFVCEGANVLPAKFIEDSFRDGYGNVSFLLLT